ncbi:MAG: ferritin-like domain-containing protein [Ferruginibacter sp.]|nr:ferritin-like domain-containing protein [Ferruginibacter sp.]
MAKSTNTVSAKKSDSKPGSKKETVTSDSSALLSFFVEELKDIYWAEKHLVKTIPKMTKAATSAELKSAFTDHLGATKIHVSRLEEVFGLLDEKIAAKKCEAMEGIIKEGESIIEDTEAGTATRDVGLIFAAQKVEHYEISTYGGLAQLARTLGKDDVAKLLTTTLNEEKEADELLTGIAENDINYEALEEA